MLPIELGRGRDAWSATGSVAQEQSARPQTSVRIPPRATSQPQSAQFTCYYLTPDSTPPLADSRLLSLMMVFSCGVSLIPVHLTLHFKLDTAQWQKQ